MLSFLKITNNYILLDSFQKFYKKKNSYGLIKKNVSFYDIKVEKIFFYSKKEEYNGKHLDSYKDLIKSFLIKKGLSKKLQHSTYKSLTYIIKYYPAFSLKKNINLFFTLYSFPVISRTIYPIFRKRKSKKPFFLINWLNSKKEKTHVFNFFKEFLKTELKFSFDKTFQLNFFKLVSQKVTLRKTYENQYVHLKKIWRYYKNPWNIEKKRLQIKYKKKSFYNMKPFCLILKKNQTKKQNLFDLLYFFSFPKKTLFKFSYFYNIKIPFYYDYKKVINLKRFHKKIFKWKKTKKNNLFKINRGFSKYLKQRKLKKNLFFILKKYLYNKNIIKLNYTFSNYINKPFFIDKSNPKYKKENNIIKQDFLVLNTLSKNYLYNVNWFFYVKRIIILEIFSNSSKNLFNINKKFNFFLKKIFKLNSIKIKISPVSTKKIVNTVLRSPHVNKKSQQHFEKVEYKQTYFFNYTDTKQLYDLLISLKVFIRQNFINVKYNLIYKN